MKTLILIAGLALCLSSCTTIDIFEKNVAIPGHAWKSSYKPSFTFTIKDSTVRYNIYLVLRHTEKYNFNNIYINLSSKGQGADSTQKAMFDLTLATPEKGWLGTGMDDIYEHRILLFSPDYIKAGDYTFTLEQIMREDPLEHVLNVGIRIEKR